MRRLLLAIAQLLARLAGQRLVTVPSVVFRITPTARILIRREDKTAPHDSSGEFKRHNVYAKLIKLYPDVAYRHLALALERAICSE